MTACLPQPDAKAPKIQSYYNIEGLIEGQIRLLDSINPSFLKTVVVDGKEELFQGKIVNGEWKGELQILREYDLNKPKLAGKYTVTETGDSIQSVTKYISKSPDETRIDTLAITVELPSKKPLKIHAHTHAANSLFKSGQTADVDFTNLEGHTIMTSYRIDGWQKLLGKPASHYSISSVLDLPQ